MRYINRMKLALALLCGALLLSSCGGKETPPAVDSDSADSSAESGITAPEVVPSTKDPLLGPVDPLLKNFFVFSGVGLHRQLNGGYRLEGDCVARAEDGSMAVMRDAKVDAMNQVTETFTVYGMDAGRVVLSLSHSYRNGTYTPFDWDHLSVKDPAVRYPERVMSVSLPSYSLPTEQGESVVLRWIEVRRARITPIQPLAGGDLYEIHTVYEYYDVAGRQIASSREPMAIYPNGEMSFSFGSVNASFDPNTMELITVSDADREIVRYAYTHTTEKYGYHLFGFQPSALGRQERVIEVYDRENGSRILRYYPDPCDFLSAYPLGNGDVLLQYRNLVEDSGIAYDYRQGDECYTLDTYLLDVTTGEATEIACDYYIEAMLGREELEERFDLSARGIAPTEYAVNVCVASRVVNGLLEASRLTVLDHDGSLMYAMDRIIPEQRIDGGDPFGFSLLSDGSYLVTLRSQTASRAIVSADGRVRAYLGTESQARVVGSYVVTADGIYDYDLNSLYRFDENGFALYATLGDRILVSAEEQTEAGELRRVCYEIVKQDGAYVAVRLFEGRQTELIAEERDYLILRDGESGTYTLYNTKLTPLLTARNAMTVMPFEGRYLVCTVLELEDGTLRDLFYVIE